MHPYSSLRLSSFHLFLSFLFTFTFFKVHYGTIVATLFYFFLSLGFMLSNYHVEFMATSLLTLQGATSLYFRWLFGVLLLDITLACGGLAFTLTGFFRILDGFNSLIRFLFLFKLAANRVYFSLSFAASFRQNELSLGLAMICSIPFRVLWWRRYFPNGFHALLEYQRLTRGMEDDGGKREEMSIDDGSVASIPVNIVQVKGM